MDFRKILNKNDNKKEILLGYNDDGNLCVNINKYPSIIITGETGSGKSILLDQIILQLINKYTSLEMGIMAIDTSGVELNYYQETNYTLLSAYADLDKAQVVLSRVLKEIERRKEIITNAGFVTVDEYNETTDNKLPLLLVAIDDDKLLLRSADIEKMLSGIISQLYGLNILFVLATSDVYNKFFESDKNMFASMLVSFDYTNKEEAKNANIKDANNLEIGAFLLRTNNEITKYHNYDFEDSIINEIVNK